ncbi:MAG: PD-(D/E)XK nuclease family protein [Bacteroidales bacterium]|nr:PD-(D/E)XK nuclease family protein [Bacteroidales bacterium]
MTPFLKQVARHYFKDDGPEISTLCFVFPNRRALRFFEHYLGQEIAAGGKGPAVSPQLFTMNDFFYRAAGAGVTGRIPLLIELYRCYKELNPAAETLDDFIFWGDTILGDFDDVDKYLVRADHLFTNVSDLKAMQDDWSWLTDTQREAVRRFTRHFLSPGSVKESFLSIWRILLPLYERFNETLTAKGMWYEGKVYRQLCERLDSTPAADIMAERFPWSDKFVFVGLNALNECEKTMLRRLRNAGLAEFCWDWRSDFIKDKHNKSSFFLGGFVQEFPQAFEPDPEGLPECEFNVLSVPGGMLQAKQLPELLGRCTRTPGIETAVVLPDENLLIPVLNSVPEHVSKLNVTMGYPISGSQLGVLLTDLGDLQLHLRERDGSYFFYHKQVWTLVSNSLVRKAIGDEGTAVLEKCRKKRAYYISEAELKGHPVLEAIFRPVVRSTAADKKQVSDICRWMQDVLVTLALAVKDDPEMQLELDFARICHQQLADLQKYELEITPSSFFRLLGQLTAMATVPFQGEPLEGMQIMGPLELRALDFDNLIILSCNEGVFPRRSVSASFVPPELRKGFGLPTYEYQDAVWAYYFYRMIQRASRVWMVYDSRTEGLKGGEKSRYLSQLELHFGVKINRFEVQTELGGTLQTGAVAKTPEHLRKLASAHLSASSIRNYADCPASFFYSKVEGLQAEKEVSEFLDSGMIGTVLHKAMEILYPADRSIDKAFIEALRKDKKRIRELVGQLICKQLNTFEVSGRNLVFADLICRYVDAVLAADAAMLEKTGRMTIKGVELEAHLQAGGFNFIGFVDRLDCTAPGKLRVVDYKTGRVEEKDLQFTGNGLPKIGFQLYLYKRMVQAMFPDAEVEGAIYQPAGLMGGEPVHCLELDDEYCAMMEQELDAILAEIADPDNPWARTDDVKKCEWCDFRTICGR